MTAYTQCLDWVMPDLPMVPVPVAVNAIRDAVIELCERALVYRQELPQILVIGPTSTVTTAASAATTNYLSLPGSAGSYVSSALSALADLDARGYLTATDYTPAAAMDALSQWTTAGNQHSWHLYVHTNGKLRLSWSTDGSTTVTIFGDPYVESSVAPTVVDGIGIWLRATLDVDNGASGKTVKFYYSNNPESTARDSVAWIQLGATKTSSGTTSIFASSSDFEIGASDGGTASPFTGKIDHVSVASTIGGAAIIDMNISDAATGAASFVSSTTGETYTVHGFAAIVANPSTLTLDSTTNFVDGALLLVDLSDGTKWRGHQSGAPSSYTITLSEPLNLDVLAGAGVMRIVDQYAITPPTGFAMVKGLQVWLNNAPIDPISPDDLDNEFNNTSFGWVGVNWRTDVNLPTRWYFPDDNTVALVMPPSTGGVGSLRINAALKPTRASTTFPTALFERYIETIAHGAKGKLMMIPTKPYSNKELGAYHEGMFNGLIGEARIQMARGKTRAPLRSHTVFGLR